MRIDKEQSRKLDISEITKISGFDNPRNFEDKMWIMPKLWQKIATVILTLILSLIVHFLKVPNPAIVIMIGVVFSTFVGGFYYGIASGFIALVYSIYYFSDANSFIRFSENNLYKILTIIVSLSATIIIVGILKGHLVSKTKQLQVAFYNLDLLASTDVLTMIPNRRRFEEALDLEWRRAIRGKTDISIAMIDVDRFKEYNDKYGHLAGDEYLRKIAEAISTCLRRPGDFVARYGGEEFAVIFPNTNLEGATHLSERIRKSVAEIEMLHGNWTIGGKITVSIGVAHAKPQIGESAYGLLKRADDALYGAKDGGRDKVNG